MNFNNFHELNIAMKCSILCLGGVPQPTSQKLTFYSAEIEI